MTNYSNAFSQQLIPAQQVNNFFAVKLASETDCSDVYSDITQHSNHYVLLDVRAKKVE